MYLNWRRNLMFGVNQEKLKWKTFDRKVHYLKPICLQNSENIEANEIKIQNRRRMCWWKRWNHHIFGKLMKIIYFNVPRRWIIDSRWVKPTACFCNYGCHTFLHFSFIVHHSTSNTHFSPHIQPIYLPII